MEIITPRDNRVNPSISLKNIIKYDEFYLQKEDTIYKIIIGKFEQNILLKCKKYELLLNHNDFFQLAHIKLDSLEDFCKLLIDSFDQNKIKIEDIGSESMKLKIKIKNNNNIIEKELTLSHKPDYKDLFINEINNNYYYFEEKLKNCRNEIIQLKNEIDTIKRNKNNHSSNPKNIQFLYDFPQNSFSNPDYSLDNTFTVFKDINNLLCLVCSNQYKSIISYNLINNKMIKEIKNAHNDYITNIRHYLDSIKNRDLILSISSYDNYLKIWNFSNFENLFNIKAYTVGVIYSACFLSYKNNNYIICGNANYLEKYLENDPIKIFNFDNKEKIMKLNNSNNKTFFIDTYDENGKIYIVTGNENYAKSYDFELNELYKTYSDKNNKNDHISIVIVNNEGIIKLIDSCSDGNIRIWNFHSGDFLKKIFISKLKLFGICLYSNDYLLVGCEDNKIKIIELEKSEICHELTGHKEGVTTIKSIIHPEYGNYLCSQGLGNDGIKIWIEKK